MAIEAARETARWTVLPPYVNKAPQSLVGALCVSAVYRRSNPMRVTKYLHQRITDRLNDQRIVVWYDTERAFGDFVGSFQAPNCRIISAAGSRLRGRREAEAIYRQLNAAESSNTARANLLIYVQGQRASDEEGRREDPFEVFAMVGAAFGDTEGERLESLAKSALPEFAEQIERLFLEGRPTLALLDRLEQAPSYPLVSQAFGTQSAVDVAVQLLAEPSALKHIAELPGCGAEVQRLLTDGLGFPPPGDAEGWEQRRRLLARHVLFSEFAFDVVAPLSRSLAQITRADETFRERIFAVADRLRATLTYRETYEELAEAVQRDLNLAELFVGATQLGQRDTFPFEERQYLLDLTRALDEDDLPAARAIAEDRRRSIWRNLPTRAQLWNVADRCVAFLETASRIDAIWAGEAKSLPAMIASYVKPGGWNELDRSQRLLEQSVAECVDGDELEPAVARCRSTYRQVVDAIQKRYIEVVDLNGWPPEGVLHQTQVFDSLVAPALAAREKVVYVLADSLRFEMGQDLAQALAELGEVAVRPAAVALPAITQVGMAALLPGAAGGLSMRQVNRELVPHLGNRPLKSSADRMALLAEKYGDRVVDVEISAFLSLATAKKRQALLKKAELVVLRDARIDSLGENATLREVRKNMTDLLADLRAAIAQLVRLGYTYVVIASDHGHVLLPEVLAGDVVPGAPDGDWWLRKRRSLLGRQVRERAGTHVFSAAHVGIQGDATELVVPNGFGVYVAGSGYFHEGLSLQECIVPVITLRAKGEPAVQGSHELRISYRSDRFTSHVIGLKVWFNSMLASQLVVKVEAFAGPAANARRVGEAAECDARNDITHEITLVPGQETPVPVLLDPDFKGDKVEIRVTGVETPIVWDRLTLQNAVLD